MPYAESRRSCVLAACGRRQNESEKSEAKVVPSKSALADGSIWMISKVFSIIFKNLSKPRFVSAFLQGRYILRYLRIRRTPPSNPLILPSNPLRKSRKPGGFSL
jgi:hypothetical protein